MENKINYTLINKNGYKYPISNEERERIMKMISEAEKGTSVLIDLGERGCVTVDSAYPGISIVPESQAISRMMTEKGYIQCEAGNWHPRGRLCEDPFDCYLDHHEEYNMIIREKGEKQKNCPVCGGTGSNPENEEQFCPNCFGPAHDRLAEIRGEAQDYLEKRKYGK